jgi:hypothetical protein
MRSLGFVVRPQQRMNSIRVIAPYKYEGMWVFDDAAVGLVREPFVAGIDTMIDRLVASIPDAEQGFRLVFSATPFPGHTVKLEWKREETGGNWYYCPQFGIEGWLCPALFKYFEKAPLQLYGRAEGKSWWTLCNLVWGAPAFRLSLLPSFWEDGRMKWSLSILAVAVLYLLTAPPIYIVAMNHERPTAVPPWLEPYVRPAKWLGENTPLQGPMRAYDAWWGRVYVLTN